MAVNELKKEKGSVCRGHELVNALHVPCHVKHVLSNTTMRPSSDKQNCV